jgi:hypothetical protein
MVDDEQENALGLHGQDLDQNMATQTIDNLLKASLVILTCVCQLIKVVLSLI